MTDEERLFRQKSPDFAPLIGPQNNGCRRRTFSVSSSRTVFTRIPAAALHQPAVLFESEIRATCSRSSLFCFTTLLYTFFARLSIEIVCAGFTKYYGKNRRRFCCTLLCRAADASLRFQTCKNSLNVYNRGRYVSLPVVRNAEVARISIFSVIPLAFSREI